MEIPCSRSFTEYPQSSLHPNGECDCRDVPPVHSELHRSVKEVIASMTWTSMTFIPESLLLLVIHLWDFAWKINSNAFFFHMQSYLHLFKVKMILMRREGYGEH